MRARKSRRKVPVEKWPALKGDLCKLEDHGHTATSLLHRLGLQAPPD
jgi:hypothetical protein